MTIQLQQLKQYCDNTFSYIEDYTFNGLQVEGKNEIKKIVFSVSLSELLIDEAIRRGADCIFVHHGFFGKSFTKIQGPLKRKLQKLLVNDISLFAYHLPLDAHPILGHNAQLCNMAQLQIIKPLECGFICGNALNLTLSQIAEHINEHIPSKYAISQSGSGPLLPTHQFNANIYKFGPEIPQKIFICSGGSGDYLDKAIREQCDLFVLGEPKEHLIQAAQEEQLNLILLGHWRSEQPGIWAVMNDVAEKLGVQAEYVEIENCV
ncbi:Nif3-related_protein [Hexamita inflata]|uniref:Nif3-related protein n=1 Tax=Hexamita inflata TaxID=28002 RepID=A0AA86P8X8_9EUKA|nr:Nif3-related protein [Hexamita inflata]